MHIIHDWFHLGYYGIEFKQDSDGWATCAEAGGGSSAEEVGFEDHHALAFPSLRETLHALASSSTAHDNCWDSLLYLRAVGDNKDFEVKVIDKEQEVGNGESKEAEGKKLEGDELCGLQWWG